MRNRFRATVLAAAVLLVGLPALADNYVVRDGTGALITRASKLISGVHYDINLLFGLNGGNPVPVAVDTSGNVGVNVQSSALPAGAATATNQAAVQAAPGSNATSATAVQGVSGMTPVATSGVTPAWTASGVTPVIASGVSTTGGSSAFTPVYGRPVNLAFNITGAATLQLERKFSGDSTWYPIGGVAGQKYVWTTTGTGTVTLSDNTYIETESGVTLRWDITSCSGCAVSYRISE